MVLTYREIDPNNYDEAYQFNLLHEYCFRDSSNAYIADSDEQRTKKTQGIVKHLLAGQNKYFCLAAFHEGEMVGAIFQDRYEIDKQPACHVHGLWVDPKFRGQGIASTLKHRGEEWARSMDCLFMDTNVSITNQPMVSLNKKLGYAVARLNFRKNIG